MPRHAPLAKAASDLRALTLAALFATALGCGGSSAPASAPSSVTGSVHGQPFPAVFGVGAAYTPPADSPANAALLVTLTTDAAYRCEQLSAGQPLSARTVSFSLFTVVHKVAGAPAGAGDYLVTQSPGTDGNFAFATYLETDAQCKAVKSATTPGSTGTIHLQHLTAGAAPEASGSFDVIFDSGDRVTGSFDTALCAGAAGSNTSCQ